MGLPFGVLDLTLLEVTIIRYTGDYYERMAHGMMM